MAFEWEDRPFDSILFMRTRADPLGQRCVALVELRLGVWWAHIPDVLDQHAGGRDEAKALVEATLTLGAA